MKNALVELFTKSMNEESVKNVMGDVMSDVLYDVLAKEETVKKFKLFL